MRIITLSEMTSLIKTNQDTYIVSKIDKASDLREVIKVGNKHCKTIGMVQTMCGALQVVIDYETGLEEGVLC